MSLHVVLTARGLLPQEFLHMIGKRMLSYDVATVRGTTPKHMVRLSLEVVSGLPVYA